jgi:hypothetical protein
MSEYQITPDDLIEMAQRQAPVQSSFDELPSTVRARIAELTTQWNGLVCTARNASAADNNAAFFAGIADDQDAVMWEVQDALSAISA